MVLPSSAPKEVTLINIVPEEIFPRSDREEDKLALNRLTYVKRGTTLRFVIHAGSTILPFHPMLCTNYPLESESHFDRKRFYTIEGKYDGIHDWTVEIPRPIHLAGSFEFYLENRAQPLPSSSPGLHQLHAIPQPTHANVNQPGFLSPQIDMNHVHKIRSYTRTFNVEPEIKINGEVLPPEGIVLQTVLTKCLGTVNTWESIFKQSASLGYNMLHFTPIQELGESGSNYSLYEQVSISSNIFHDKNLDFSKKEAEIKKAVATAETEYKMLSMVDVVWNHTANNTPWLSEHPECGYNLENSPHLKVAFALEQGLMDFSQNIINNKYPDISPNIQTDEDVHRILDVFRYQVWPSLKIWEYSVIDVESTIAQFREAIQNHSKFERLYGHEPITNPLFNHIEVFKSDAIYRTGDGDRFNVKVKIDIALAIFYGTENVSFSLRRSLSKSREFLSLSSSFTNLLNTTAIKTDHQNEDFQHVHVSTSDVDKMCKRLRHAIDAYNLPIYQQLDQDLRSICTNLYHRINRMKISEKRPLVDPYFTIVKQKGTNKTAALANNGWIWGGNPLEDFAGPNSRAYFLREVIIWGDCVKLRYGTRREDNPWLWDHMQKYTEWSASIFHALRIDNAHSTPIHLAQALLDAARRIRPNIYVVAELFTGSDQVDSYYVAKLGINSLIREAMAPHDSWDLGRHIHRFGGSPVASVRWHMTSNEREIAEQSPYALFFDCTHDNQTPIQKRSAEDSLSTAGLVSMATCAAASTFGYDFLFPKTVHVVDETRRYKPVEVPDKGPVFKGVGLAPAKRLLNRLHRTMAEQGFHEIHVHQADDVITVQRHNPSTHEAVYMTCHTSFHKHLGNLSPGASLVRIPAKIVKLEIAASLEVPNKPIMEDTAYLTGVDSTLVLKTSLEDLQDFCEIREVDEKGTQVTYVQLRNFPPGSILGFRTQLFPEQQAAWTLLTKQLDDSPGLAKSVDGLSLVDINTLLYRCEEEEQAAVGIGAYDIPKFGKLPYCGIASLHHQLHDIRRNNNMGHPLFDNLRDGNWIMDYTVSRLTKYPALHNITQWISVGFEKTKQLPRFLIPKYFDQIITKAFAAVTQYAWTRMSQFVEKSNDKFVKALALGSIQFYGYVPNSSLRWKGTDPSLAAGLPHFSSGYMRTWGRDTFISLRGLMLLTGRFAEARELILGFGSCLRHGLIPNLLDSGRNPRYNARDSTWFWLQAVQDYCTLSEEGVDFLQARVERLFMDDYDEPDRTQPLPTSSIADIIQEIMQRHASGISFRERNAGTRIDANMKDEGFNVEVYVDWQKTAFVFGGNRWNCGTWMDKMGESDKADNKGIPASPRDGAAVEITGLLKSTLRWLTKLYQEELFPHSGVKISTSLVSKQYITYEEWNEAVRSNFENYFWVPTNPKDDVYYNVMTNIVNRRGIYRDTFGSSLQYTDYQLRPNFPIAMTVAPELFNRVHAQQALAVAEDALLGPLGMKTLDPKDWNYRPFYDMSNDTDNHHLAKGFNYHQGPEWLWPVGCFLRAKLLFADTKDTLCVLHNTSCILMKHKEHIRHSPWEGLPELTNQNGAECYYGCPTQAWSFATLMDTMYDLYNKQLVSQKFLQ